MNLWEQFEKQNNQSQNSKGISFHYEKGIDNQLRNLYLDFAKWLRLKYYFPVHINVYILDQERVKLLSGVWAYGSFRWYEKRPPRIKVPSKIEKELLSEYTIDT